MKKNFLKSALTTTAVLSLLLTSCGNSTNSKNGVFTGTAKGFAGDVKASISLENGKIVKAEIEGLKETPALGGEAIKKTF